MSVNVGIVGATGQVGGVMRSVLAERSFPVSALRVTGAQAPDIDAREVTHDTEIARVSLVGAGMKTNPGVAATMFEVLAAEGVNIEMISTSSIRISCVVRARDVERAVLALHAAFELDKTPL